MMILKGNIRFFYLKFKKTYHINKKHVKILLKASNIKYIVKTFINIIKY